MHRLHPLSYICVLPLYRFLPRDAREKPAKGWLEFFPANGTPQIGKASKQ
jgi:hypothetical protein